MVISPPGGIGEIASIEAARLGGSVKWFVVSAPSTSTGPGPSLASANDNNIALTAETLAAIEKAGGSMELAGATFDALLASTENNEDGNNNENSALSAMSAWCANPKSLICTYDGAFEEKRRVDRSKTTEQREATSSVNEEELIRSGIRLAAREAVSATQTKSKIALLAEGEEMEVGEEKKGDGFFGGLFGGNEVQIPETMDEALEGTTAVIRYGELFGAAESSPESSPFMGGPRRDPVVRDMYTMRSVRIDPTVSVSGNVNGMSKSNRLALGEAASRLGLGKISSASTPTNKKMDVSLSSFAGTDAPTDEEWTAEFGRIQELMSSPAAKGGARLFSAEFSTVPSTKRLAEWLATKWAPAILRSYDIAGTRVGARAVYAAQPEENKIEIVWLEMVDFESVTSGKMVIEVNEKGMVASRGAGDAAKGFGKVSMTPLPGEDILVRRLADAASQAVEKGLAVKPQLTKKAVVEEKKPVQTTVVASSTAPAQDTPASASSGPGPRSAGARRSSERNRGSRKRKSPPSAGES